MGPKGKEDVLLVEKNSSTEDFNCIDIQFSKMDPTDPKDFSQCREVIRNNLWSGEYRKAVNRYSLLKELFFKFFRPNMKVKDDLKELKSIYLSPYHVYNLKLTTE